MLEMVRSLWNATEQADTAVRDWSQKAIVDGIARLNRQVTSKLRLVAAIPPTQPRLFSEEQVPCAEAEPAYPEASQPRFPEPKLRPCAKALTKQAWTFIPHAGGFSNLDAYREHLATTLPFNSRATQRRNASYLISRYFRGDCFNSDLPRFAAALKECDALFYLTCRTEKIVAQVADEVVFPSLPQAGVSRTKIRDFVQGQFPESRSAKQAANACVETYTAFGIGSAPRTRLNVSLREGSLASIAYVLHLEFPEPGMYGFERATGRHLYVILGTYGRLERYERVDFREARSPRDAVWLIRSTSTTMSKELDAALDDRDGKQSIIGEIR